ncbi:hypothetical protein V6N11_076231 [Hibiscus sabdariffa]|uniref:Uncharacterized protein n=1 Tax=Hibiscus sabdariffa TaxID=183260 RepID=A0ABR2Q5M8_9ROSI
MATSKMRKLRVLQLLAFVMLLLSATVPATPEQDACFKKCTIATSCGPREITCIWSCNQCCYEGIPNNVQPVQQETKKL